MPILNPTAKYHCQRYGYRLPELPYIGRNPRARKLLQYESERSDAISKCAIELLHLLGLKDHYMEAVPEALAAVLDSYDSRASCAAAIAYLHRQGYTVADKDDT